MDRINNLLEDLRNARGAFENKNVQNFPRVPYDSLIDFLQEDCTIPKEPKRPDPGPLTDWSLEPGLSKRPLNELVYEMDFMLYKEKKESAETHINNINSFLPEISSTFNISPHEQKIQSGLRIIALYGYYLGIGGLEVINDGRKRFIEQRKRKEQSLKELENIKYKDGVIMDAIESLQDHLHEKNYNVKDNRYLAGQREVSQILKDYLISERCEYLFKPQEIFYFFQKIHYPFCYSGGKNKGLPYIYDSNFRNHFYRYVVRYLK